MEAVCQLTGGLAHDFNNLPPALAVALNSQNPECPAGSTRLDCHITAAQKRVKRAAALTHRLLAFSRRQTLDPKPTNVNKLVADMEELIGVPSVPLSACMSDSAGLWSTLVDPNQLENALLNLCLNVRAMRCRMAAS